MALLDMMPGGGAVVDFDALTAGPGDVLEGLIFLGAGSDEEQEGTLLNRQNMHGAPGKDSRNPTVPVHAADQVDIVTDTEGNLRIILSPPVGKYPGGSNRAYVGCTPSDIGAAPSIIANGQEIAGVRGTFGKDSTAGTGDVRGGKIYYDKAGRQVGTADDYAAAAVTLKCGEKHQIKKGFHQAGTVTAATLASQTKPGSTEKSAAAGQILSGFGAWADGTYRKGSIVIASTKKKTTLTSSDTRPVVIQSRSTSGDARIWYVKNADGAERLCVLAPVNGYYENVVIGCSLADIRSVFEITAGKILKGNTIAGAAGTAKEYKYKSGTATSGSSLVDSSDYMYLVQFDIGFTPTFGIVAAYVNGNRDVTVYAAANQSSPLWGAFTNWNQQKLHGFNSVAADAVAPYAAGATMKVPVAYKNATYRYWFCGTSN